MANTKLMDQRLRRKKKQPAFIARESHHLPKVKPRWRFPGGNHSLVRMECAGKPRLPTPGYGSPKAVYGLHHSGLCPILVHSENDLNKIDPAVQGAILAADLGQKKRSLLLVKAQEKKIRVLNFKDSAKKIQTIAAELSSRQKGRQEKIKAHGQKDEEKRKKAAEKEKKEKENKEVKPSVEEKLQEEKELREKTIIQKE